ncbi:DUF1722 domain-containing protein [Campylobacter pinnipediorum]|uniref:DUF1722 domain-containing protein n=1 Tax=Campylobacter pinnipediorum TaxID=1965231 RepID=UPI000995D492|nr:YbgA family protein [Campylobacter pinnipediorum]
MIRLYKQHELEKITKDIKKNRVGIFTKNTKEKCYDFHEKENARYVWFQQYFLMQIFAYKDIFEFLQTKPSFKSLIEFHASYKYLIYSKSHKHYKQLGNIVANRSKKSLCKVLDEYKIIFLDAISLKESIAKTYNIFLHMYGYFKNYITKDEKQKILKLLNMFKQGLVSLKSVLEVLVLYIKKFDIKYLENQKILNPYPKKLEFYLYNKDLY